MNLLETFFFDMLSRPWVLLFLVGVVLLFIVEAFAKAPGAVVLSTGERARSLRSNSGAILRRLPALLRALGLGMLIVALAEPLNGFQVRKDRADIIDIMLCVDVSASMQQPDFVAEGRPRDRLYVTKAAVRDFIANRKERDESRYGLDRVGLILYARYAWTQAPLTLDYEILLREVAQAEVETDQRRAGTAIGSALGLAVYRLKESEAETKVIILLTDGLNNAGELDPITAAQVAEKYGIRVYTIGAGSTEPAGMTLRNIFQTFASQPIDEETLKRIAEITGGRYYRATDLESLQQAYAEIDQLEHTEVEIGDYYEYEAAFMPYLILGALLLGTAVVTRRVWFEPAP